METRARYALIGLFMLLVIGASFAFVYWLENKGGFGERETYRVQFESSVSGLLIGSAAALAVVPATAHAADAIVAAEPEPVEYVRVCDAYGTGYFYIPGTETCLKIEGYIRFQVDVAPDARSSGSPSGQVNNSDWDAFTRAQVQFTAKSDTEYGPLTDTNTNGEIDPGDVWLYKVNGQTAINLSQPGLVLPGGGPVPGCANATDGAGSRPTYVNEARTTAP